MSRENYDNYDQEDLTYYAADHSASDSINSELLEKKDPAINQHENESQRHKHTPDHYENEDDVSDIHREENDTSDPFFQKNAAIAQDLDEDLKDDDDEDDDFDNDANRRTLDESKPDEDKDDDY